MLYPAEIERFETSKWVVLKVEEHYYYVPSDMLPEQAEPGDQVRALMSDGKILSLMK
jgi:hypothetical protein